MTLSRDQLAEIADDLASDAEVTTRCQAGAGLRIVVLVCDKTGDYVGVGMTTRLDDAMAMMRCALAREDAKPPAPNPELVAYRNVDLGGLLDRLLTRAEHLSRALPSDPKPIHTEPFTTLGSDDFKSAAADASNLRIDGLKPLWLPTGVQWAVTMVCEVVRTALPGLPEHFQQTAKKTLAEWGSGRSAFEQIQDDDDFASSFAALCLSAGRECTLVTWEAKPNCWRMGVLVDGVHFYGPEGRLAEMPHPCWCTDPKTGITRSPLVAP